MTNDTSTLNGALRELGETMAANLTTQGVPSTYDEGLTTLAGKILDITPGPGPTPVPASMTLTSTKSILSYYDSEYAVLTATVYDSSSDPLSGQTVTMKVYDTDDTLIDTLSVTDNSDGTYTASYYAEGTGDIYIKAECSSLIQTYVVTDAYYYNDGTNTSSLECPSGVSVTTSDGYLVLPKPSSEKIITVPKSLGNSDNWEYSVKIARKEGNKVIGLTFNDSSYYLSSSSTTGKYYCHFSSDEYWNTDSALNDVITVRRQNGVTKILINNVEQTSKTTSHKSSFKCGFYTISSTYQYVDDIILKPL